MSETPTSDSTSYDRRNGPLAGVSCGPVALILLILGVGGGLVFGIHTVVEPLAEQGNLSTDMVEVAEEVVLSAATVPEADVFTVGSVNEEGEFEAFEDGRVPAEVTEFSLQVAVEGTEEAVVAQGLEKGEGVVIWAEPMDGAPGEFVLSGFADGARFNSEASNPLEYNSVLRDFQY